MNKCLRCGKCCFIYKDAEHELRGEGVRCKYLLDWGDKSYCMIYGRRYGRIIAVVEGVPIRCNNRLETDRIIEGCPYNADIYKLRELVLKRTTDIKRKHTGNTRN